MPCRNGMAFVSVPPRHSHRCPLVRLDQYGEADFWVTRVKCRALSQTAPPLLVAALRLTPARGRSTRNLDDSDNPEKLRTGFPRIIHRFIHRFLPRGDAG